MDYTEFEKLMQDREVRIEQASSGLPFAMLSVRTRGSNVIGLYQVPYAWVAPLAILGNWHSRKKWWKEGERTCSRK
jgi:hypothetical protein